MIVWVLAETTAGRMSAAEVGGDEVELEQTGVWI